MAWLQSGHFNKTITNSARIQFIFNSYSQSYPQEPWKLMKHLAMFHGRPSIMAETVFMMFNHIVTSMLKNITLI
jgi:hypothetical protein